MITNHQRKLYWTNLHAVIEKVGTVAPRGPSGNVGSSVTLAPSAQDISAFRESFHAAHNLPKSTKDFTKKNFDAFLAACTAILQPANLKPQLRAFDQPKTRLLNKILVAQAAQLRALDIPAALDYIAKICADKFHGRTPSDLRHDQQDAHDPDSHPENPVHPVQYSELEKLLFTIADRIKQLRQQRGWTQHDLNLAANLKCGCAQCRPKPTFRGSRGDEALTPSARPELATATAESNPF
jgi:hypothetical protein